MKKYFIFILLLAYSCKENSNPVKYEPVDSTKVPVIYSFTPSHGYPKAGVLIYGKNFYSTTDTIKVLFGDKLAPILGNWQIKDTSIIQTKVPDSALTSKIIIKRNQFSDTTKDYFYVDFKDSNKVINFTPQKGIIGTKVEIVNNQFLSSLLAKYDNKFKIYFGNIEAAISNITLKSIKTLVPVGASTAKIKLTFDTVSCISKDIFTIGKPTIISVIPNQGRPGDTIIIKGDYFLSDKSNIKIKFGNTDAQILDANETQIKTIVPPNAVTSKIYVTIFKENAETNDNFIILKHIIDSFEPKIGTYGTKVTIYGKYFGNNSNDIKIFFNNVEAIVTSVQDNKIETKVPDAVREIKNQIKVVLSGGAIVSNDSFYVELSRWQFAKAKITINLPNCNYNSLKVQGPNYENTNYSGTQFLNFEAYNVFIPYCKYDTISRGDTIVLRCSRYECTYPPFYGKSWNMTLIIDTIDNRLKSIFISYNDGEAPEVNQARRYGWYIHQEYNINSMSYTSSLNGDTLTGYITNQELNDNFTRFSYESREDYNIGGTNFVKVTSSSISKFDSKSYIKIELIPW